MIDNIIANVTKTEVNDICYAFVVFAYYVWVDEVTLISNVEGIIYYTNCVQPVSDCNLNVVNV